MNCTADLSPDEFKRLSGLYRRWELPDVFELHCQYLIEDAGTHADGSPLFAVFAAGKAIEPLENEPVSGSINR